MTEQLKIGELDPIRLQQLLVSGDFALVTGPLVFRIRCSFPDVARAIHVLYAEHQFHVRPNFSDFHVEVRAPRNLRRWLRPQAEFFIDGEAPFEPLPRDQAPALLEWGMNWAIAASCHQWFSIHAASLERNGNAVILPAPPGSGKSTLCAALAFRGWRLLSDELTLIDPVNFQCNGLVRPINLKNASIDIMRGYQPEAEWSPETYDTSKGRVAHLKPPGDSVRRMRELSVPRWIVFPKYVPDAEPLLTPRSKIATFMPLSENSFNYGTLGLRGFEVVAGLLDQCDVYDFAYSRLDDAVEVFDWLIEESRTEHLTPQLLLQ